MEQAWRWCRRNPILSALAATAAACVLAVAVIGSVASWRLNEALKTTRAAEREGRAKLFEAYLAQADANRLSRRGGQRFASLARIAEAAQLARELELPSNVSTSCEPPPSPPWPCPILNSS